MSSRVFCSVLTASLLTGCVFDLGSLTRTEPLREKVILGSDGPKIALVDIEGVITESVSRSRFGLPRPGLLATTREALDLAEADDDVAALLLRIHSPGGTVSASETLHHEVERWKRETGKPVVVYMQGMATSGGYYVAMAADEIVAQPTSITGSIGVIMAGVNLSGLMKRFGVEDQTLVSGSFKDAGSPLRPMRKEERKYLQAVVDDLNQRFRDVVLAGRPALDPDALARLADGRIFTAGQALEVGLVDAIGHLEDAVEAAERRIGADRSRVIVYRRPGEYRENVYSRGPGPPTAQIDIDVLSLDLEPLEPGFYYIWPPALGLR